MMLLLWVALLVVLFWIFFPMGPSARFKKYADQVHPYSGLDPDNWRLFLENLNQFEQSVSVSNLDAAADSLYRTIENIRDFGLAIRRADDGHHQEALNSIANQLGYEGEFMINQEANDNGYLFFPKYLNDSLLDYPENVRADDPGPVRSHAQ
jgi:hypothetical protein